MLLFFLKQACCHGFEEIFLSILSSFQFILDCKQPLNTFFIFQKRAFVFPILSYTLFFLYSKLHFVIRNFSIEVQSPGTFQREYEISNGFINDYVLSKKDRKRIINKILPFIQSEHELNFLPLFQDEREKAIQSFRCRKPFKK